jgi:hypothetical protein
MPAGSPGLHASLGRILHLKGRTTRVIVRSPPAGGLLVAGPSISSLHIPRPVDAGDKRAGGECEW